MLEDIIELLQNLNICEGTIHICITKLPQYQNKLSGPQVSPSIDGKIEALWWWQGNPSIDGKMEALWWWQGSPLIDGKVEALWWQGSPSVAGESLNRW